MNKSVQGTLLQFTGQFCLEMRSVRRPRGKGVSMIACRYLWLIQTILHGYRYEIELPSLSESRPIPVSPKSPFPPPRLFKVENLGGRRFRTDESSSASWDPRAASTARHRQPAALESRVIPGSYQLMVSICFLLLEP